MARKANILAAGGYDLNHQFVEDYSLWLKLGLKAKLANLPEIMVSYRVNSYGITRTKNREQIRNVLRLIKEYKGDYPRFHTALLKWYLQYALSFLGLTKGATFLKSFR